MLDMSGDLFPNDAILVNLVYAEADEEIDEDGRYNDLHREREAFIYQSNLITDLEDHLSKVWPGHTKLFITRVSLYTR